MLRGQGQARQKHMLLGELPEKGEEGRFLYLMEENREGPNTLNVTLCELSQSQCFYRVVRMSNQADEAPTQVP